MCIIMQIVMTIRYILLCVVCRGGLTAHGAPGQYGIMGPLCPCPNSKKPMKKVPGASHWAPY
ncbi:unnamed protein product [Staurois parvus]|uniref:Secreted protein n=1 Tax=Staurois parvus TaxID=386267 RepID=A0ABN9F6L9_9NEOB|nr:unnamed protein product [Staurois parvus]